MSFENTQEEKTYIDIIVIGAGPAGSTFAKHVAEAGLSVLLIDGQNEKYTKPCGGLLSPDAQEIFAKSEKSLPKNVLTDPQIFSVKTIDIEQNLVRNYQRYYLNMDRAAFDGFLLSEVPDAVEVIRGRCLDITLDAGQSGIDIYRLKIKTEDGEVQDHACRYVVGADGASSIVRKKFYAPMKQYVAIQEWFEKEEGDDMLYACIFDERTSESCSWVIRKDDNMIFGGCFDMKTGKDDYEEQLERFRKFSGMSLSKVIKREACLVNVPQKKKDFITGINGVYLIGEAAGFISASSFEGISNAMNSGRYLAESFKEAFSKENLERIDLHLSCCDTRHGIKERVEASQVKDFNSEISESYALKCKKLKKKLYLKVLKKKLLFTPSTRKLIMKSGVQSL